MRIIAGRLGGRVLIAPRGDETRPTSDRVREALFNILGPPPDGCRVLDLFAGSGALSMEALSRGAVAAVLVERSAAAVEVIRKNARALQVETVIEIVRKEAPSVLTTLGRFGAFQWIFVDPPYRGPLVEQTLTMLGASGLVALDATVVVEHPRKPAPAESYGFLVQTDSRRYGDTCVSFYKRREK